MPTFATATRKYPIADATLADAFSKARAEGGGTPWQPYNILVMVKTMMGEQFGGVATTKPLDGLIYNFVDTDPLREDYMSLDRGVCAINSYWWAVKNQLDYHEPYAACRIARRIFVSRGGPVNPVRGYTAWYAYRYRWHVVHDTRARAALSAAGVKL